MMTWAYVGVSHFKAYALPGPLLLGPPAGLVEGAPAARAAAVDEDGAHQVKHQTHGEHVQQRLLDHHADRPGWTC